MGFPEGVSGRVRLLALAAVLVVGIPTTSSGLHAGSTSQASQPSVAFFSSVTEREFARLQAVAIRPATRDHGPFQVPAPGIEIDTPVLHLLDLRCAPEDWGKLLATVEAWQRLPSARPPCVALPDGRLLSFSRSPVIQGGALGGPARLVTGDAAAAQVCGVRIAHDGIGELTLEVIPLATRHAPSPAPVSTATNTPVP